MIHKDGADGSQLRIVSPEFMRHVERLLWQFGLFPWRMPDGFMRVEVPYGNDPEVLAARAAATTARGQVPQ